MVDMTQTSALIINAILGVVIVALVAYVIGVPSRFGRRPIAGNVVYVPGNDDERDLSRAA
jgi:hypothetical protein